MIDTMSSKTGATKKFPNSQNVNASNSMLGVAADDACGLVAGGLEGAVAGYLIVEWNCWYPFVHTDQMKMNYQHHW